MVERLDLISQVLHHPAGTPVFVAIIDVPLIIIVAQPRGRRSSAGRVQKSPGTRPFLVLGTFLSRPVSIGIGALLFCPVWLVSRRFRQQDREEEAMSIRPQTIRLISISIREPPRAPMTNSPRRAKSCNQPVHPLDLFGLSRSARRKQLGESFWFVSIMLAVPPRAAARNSGPVLQPPSGLQNQSVRVTAF
jgi:hypothetical protein